MTFKPMVTQEQFAEMWAREQRVLNFSGCGTGKTLACIHTIKTHWPNARVLVVATLSILQKAWGDDLNFGWPEVKYGIASAGKREKVVNSDAQWVITNHDGIKDFHKNGWDKQFDVLIVDEADAFRNRTSARSKAMAYVTGQIPKLSIMTGTPTPKSVTDIWHLAFLVDRGERLGKNFFGFRGQVCTPKAIPGVAQAFNWEDKDGAQDVVAALLSDITFRVSLDDIEELPSTITREITVDLPAKLRREYETMRKESMMMLDSGELVNAIHAGARMQKLLQMVSGGIYNEQGEARDLHPDRHKLVLDLVEEAEQSLVAFNWHHQRDGLVKEAKRRKLNYAVIDGSVPVKKREEIVDLFQAGKLQVIFAHPQSAGHGLTLTKAKRIIWASPNYRADLYTQFNHRMRRKGQTSKTEIIHIAAAHSVEQQVYLKLLGKKVKMDDLLSTLTDLARAA